MTDIVDWAQVPPLRAGIPALPVVEACSQPERVTFFEDRATVMRKASARVPAGRSVLILDGITPLVDDPSVVASSGNPRVGVLAVRVRRRVVRRPRDDRDQVEGWREEAREALECRREAALEQERARAQEGRASALLDQWHSSLARVPRVAVEDLPAWEVAYRDIERSLNEACDAQELSQRRMDEALHRKEEAESRLRLGDTVLPHHEAAIEVQVEAPEGGRVDLEITYRTPCALWRPEHVARLRWEPSPESPAAGAGEDGAPGAVPVPPLAPRRSCTSGLGSLAVTRAPAGCRLEVVTWATVWQATGETWEDVACRLSTARPAQSAAPPLLEDDVLALRSRVDVERHSVVVEARDQAVAMAGLERGVRAVDEMPGVDDGGEPVSLEVRAPATIVPDGLPVRLEVARVEMACEVDRIAWPELSEAVFVRATATWTGRVPLLAGPVRLVGGEALVGRALTRFVAPGEPFEMGFGIDDSLRVRRQVTEGRDTAMLVGTQRITRKVWLGISNMGAEKRHLKVVERIPVSEVAAVKIVVVSAGGGVVDEADGFVRFDVDVEPNATRTLELEYRIEAGPKVALPF